MKDIIDQILVIILPNVGPSNPEVPYPTEALVSIALTFVGSMLIVAFFGVRPRTTWPWRMRVMSFFIFFPFASFLLSFGFVWWFSVLGALSVAFQYRSFGISFCKAFVLAFENKRPESIEEYKTALRDFNEDRRKYGRFYVIYLAKLILNRSKDEIPI